MTSLAPDSRAAALARARSMLFVPGNREDRFAKAVATDADVVVVDLEDAVVDAGKAAARESVVRWLSGGGRAVVRVNAVQSRFFDDDRAALSGVPGLLGVMLPKADDAAVSTVLAGAHIDVPLIPLVETAVGIRDVHLVAGAPQVVRLALGTIDLALDLAMDETWESLLLARSSLVLASRAAGLGAPIDGVTVRLDDLASTARDARAARALGFGGKLCIHPSQVGPVNLAFSPSTEEIAWARAVAAASGGGAVRHEGLMIDEPVRERARRILACADGWPTPRVAVIKEFLPSPSGAPVQLSGEEGQKFLDHREGFDDEPRLT